MTDVTQKVKDALDFAIEGSNAVARALEVIAASTAFPIYKHVKSGGDYSLLLNARIEATCEHVVVYRGVEQGDIWVRPASEFFDGRFTLVKDGVAPASLVVTSKKPTGVVRVEENTTALEIPIKMVFDRFDQQQGERNAIALGKMDAIKREFAEIQKRGNPNSLIITQEDVEKHEAALPVPTAPYAPTINLTPGQQGAFDLVMRAKASPKDHPLVLLVGYAGTGKTTLLKEIIGAVGPCILLAPTGKAAMRMRELTGADVNTIHSWLYAPQEDPRTGEVMFIRKPPKLVASTRSKLVLVDEASMVNAEVYADLKMICEVNGLSLILVGDGFQLPPVQARGATAFEPLRLETPHKAILTEVVRQAAGNSIIEASLAVREGRSFDGLNQLYRYSPAQAGETAFNFWGHGGVTIAHRNTTRGKLNVEIRGRRGFAATLIAQPSEPLLVTTNNGGLGLWNGEVVGFSHWEVEPRVTKDVWDRYANKTQTCNFGLGVLDNGKRAVLCHQEMIGALEVGRGALARTIGREWVEMGQVWDASLNEMVEREVPIPMLACNFGYVFTAHKAQGSQWPGALVILEPSVRLREEEGRRWLYTAITRAEKECAYVMGNV